MMFVGDGPSFTILAKSDRQAQPNVGVLSKLVFGSATKQGPSESNILTGGDVQRFNLERCPRPLPFEEWRPYLAVSVESPDALVRRGHIEHHNVFTVIRDHH